MKIMNVPAFLSSWVPEKKERGWLTWDRPPKRENPPVDVWSTGGLHVTSERAPRGVASLEAHLIRLRADDGR